MPIFGIYLFKEKFQLFIPYAYTYKIIVTKKRYMIIMIFSRDLAHCGLNGSGLDVYYVLCTYIYVI